MELSGRVKWFNVDKGYGFVTVDGDDYLLHSTRVPRDKFGHKSAPEGATVLFEPSVEGRPRVERVIAIDVSTAINVTAVTRNFADRVAQHDIKNIGAFEVAIVKWFHGIKGFGFLARGSGTEDVFLHAETLRKAKIEFVQPGDALLVRYGTGPKGLMAAEVKRLQVAGAAE